MSKPAENAFEQDEFYTKADSGRQWNERAASSDPGWNTDKNEVLDVKPIMAKMYGCTIDQVKIVLDFIENEEDPDSDTHVIVRLTVPAVVAGTRSVWSKKCMMPEELRQRHMQKKWEKVMKAADSPNH